MNEEHDNTLESPEYAEGGLASEDTAGSLPAPSDSVSRALMIVALLLLIAVLSVGIGMVLYLLDGFDLPRSAAERDIAAYETAARENPEVQATHVQLASAYARAGRTDLALESVARARQISNNATVDLAEGDVLRLSGELDQALVFFETAEARANDEYEAAELQMQETGIAFEIDKTVLVQATHGQALVLWELGDSDDAIAAMQRALEAAPNDASLYAVLGRYLLETGDAEGAEEAFLAALRFVPNYPPAVEGLRQLEEAAQ